MVIEKELGETGNYRGAFTCIARVTRRYRTRLLWLVYSVTVDNLASARYSIEGDLFFLF